MLTLLFFSRMCSLILLKTAAKLSRYPFLSSKKVFLIVIVYFKNKSYKSKIKCIKLVLFIVPEATACDETYTDLSVGG